VSEAKAAPLRRLLAYVWPAVALSPAVEVLAILLPDARASQEEGNPFAVPGWVRPLSPVPLIGGSSGGDPALSARAVMSSGSAQPSPYNSPLPGDGGMSFLATIFTIVAALIGVVALARLTVGDEFFSMRWLH
jgi:hypothetical protein